MTRHAVSTFFILFVLTAATPTAEPVTKNAPSLFDALPARNIGPANMGGRIVDLAVVESDPKMI